MNCAAYSIPASEHSTITAWAKPRVGRLRQHPRKLPEGLVACVSDSYDIYNAVRNLWGGALRDKVHPKKGRW